MKDYDFLTLGLLVIVVAVVLFFGVQSFIRGAFMSSPDQKQNIYQGRSEYEKQRDRMEQIQKSQELMMERRHQQLRDYRR